MQAEQQYETTIYTVSPLLRVPPEVILRIFSYLDLPELHYLASLSPLLHDLSQDRALHRMRILVVAPSRIQHALFAYGGSLRPTIADLVHSGVIRGLGIERRWRHGLYFSSPQSVKQYESSLRIQRSHVRNVLTVSLQHSRSDLNASSALESLRNTRILPDVEFTSFAISRSLLPIVRKLKWSIQRDKVSRAMRDRDYKPGDLLGWFEGRGRSLMTEGERVRLAVCPGVRKLVGFYEEIGRLTKGTRGAGTSKAYVS